MLKLTSLAIALLTVIAIAPQSEAMPIDVQSISFNQPARGQQPQIFVNIGGHPQYSNRWSEKRHRQLELRREREREAERRRHEYYSQRHHSRDAYRPQVRETNDRYGEYRAPYQRDR
jgi:hypothetical protein